MEVVVGVDGSQASLTALAYAAWAADRRGLPLHLLHAHERASAFTGLTLDVDTAATAAAEAAAWALTDLAGQVRAVYPGLTVTTAVVAGHPAGMLVRASQEAALVVVGSRGQGGFAGLKLGSAGAQLSAHSAAPVVVLRPPDLHMELGTAPGPRPVVVGVDGIPDSEGAVEFAFTEALARSVPVVVLYAWWLVPVHRLADGNVPIDPDLATAEEEARRLLVEATAGSRERHPEVAVELRPAHALNPAKELLEVAQEAGLLVVSRHGGNALTRLLFSSVGDVAVREAPCPVAVVPETPPRGQS